MQLEDRGAEEDLSWLVWKTSSRNMYNFTSKGARWPEVRRLALQIKYREKQTKAEEKLVWVALCPVEIQMVDDRSRLSTSTGPAQKRATSALCQVQAAADGGRFSFQQQRRMPEIFFQSAAEG